MASGNHNKMVKKLRRMAKNKKNKDYQDQIYYAIGNIYLANQDAPPGVSGHSAVPQNGIAKPWYCCVWVRFIGTRRTISTHNAVTPNWSAYWTKKMKLTKAERRSGILTELEPHLSAIKLQDSLQWLAKLPENRT